jgi:PPOX class F420-dependent enzyme/OxyR family protein
MSDTFTPGEEAYLRATTLGRLSTLTADGSPTVVPVGYQVGDDGAVHVVGHELERSAKAHNLARDGRFAFVVDDGIGATARGVLVRGHGELLRQAEGAVLVLRAETVTSWGIDTHPFTRQRRVVGSGTT